MTSARTASSTSSATMAPPTSSAGGKRRRPRRARGSFAAMTSVNRASIADAGIGDAVQQVGGQVGQAVDRGQHQDGRLHQRQILAFERMDQQAAEAGIGEDALDGDDAADQ